MKIIGLKTTAMIIFALISINSFGISPASAKFINAFLIKIGGNRFTNSDATARYLAQYSLIITRKMQSADIGKRYGSTWKAIKRHNPNTKIHLYTIAWGTNPIQDSAKMPFYNTLARYMVSRGHSDGKLADHNDYFLHRNGKLWFHKFGGYLLDPGDVNVQDYSLEATIKDYYEQPWVADGVFTDILASQLKWLDPESDLDEYSTQGSWSKAVQNFINYLTKGLHSKGQTFIVNHGNTKHVDVKKHWIGLNAKDNPPDFLLEEGAHAVFYGKGSDIQFFPEYHWKNQIDTMAAMTNIGYLSAASTDLTDLNDTGVDNYGKTFTGWDALYFAMGSYCLGKDNNDAFFFNTGDYKYHRWDQYYEEYDMIDLGMAVGGYHVLSYGGKNIYWREFEKGYVFVNPTNTKVTSIKLPESCKHRTHNNLYQNIESLQSKSSLTLNAHRAAFLYKIKSHEIKPPKNLRRK